jgi:DNA sulfur modification protein DndB
VGAELFKVAPNDWKQRLRKLQDINWSKQNRDWEGVCMVANSVVSNRQARAATKAYIKKQLGLALTDAEARALTGPAPAGAAE